MSVLCSFLDNFSIAFVFIPSACWSIFPYWERVAQVTKGFFFDYKPDALKVRYLVNIIIYMFIRKYVYIYIHIYSYILDIYSYIFDLICIYIYIYIIYYIYIYMYVFVYILYHNIIIYIYIYVYIYIYISNIINMWRD